MHAFFSEYLVLFPTILFIFVTVYTSICHIFSASSDYLYLSNFILQIVISLALVPTILYYLYLSNVILQIGISLALVPTIYL